MGPKLGCVALLSRLLSHPGKDLWVLSWEGGNGWEIGTSAVTYPPVVTTCAKLNHATSSTMSSSAVSIALMPDLSSLGCV